MNTYWMVHKVGERAQMPSVMHVSELSAVNEASRLAEANPGVEFTVLSSQYSIKTKPIELQTTYHYPEVKNEPATPG